MGSFPERRVTLALTCDQAFFFFKGGRGERHKGIIGRGHDLRLPLRRANIFFLL